MTGYFKIIRTSAPHIYHSALVLAPKKSIVQKLYGSYAHPFMRVVCGAPISWDQNTAATTFPFGVNLVVWSPCNRFIAVTSNCMETINVLDLVTLQQLQVLKSPQIIFTDGSTLVFSPDSCVLTYSSNSCMIHKAKVDSHQELSVISWDLQTGGIVSVIRWQELQLTSGENPSITYLANGKVVGVLYWYHNDTNTAIVSTCNVVSGIHMHSCSLNSDIQLPNNIWTHGESLQVATADATTIIIWEVRFILGDTLTKVKTLPHIGNIQFAKQVQLLPTLSRLGLTFDGEILVWDVQNSKCLLDCMDINIGASPAISFSSDGCFFACSIASVIYLWKGSPTGYILHGTVASKTMSQPRVLFSWNGESMATFYCFTIQLWNTNSFTTSPSSILTQAPQETNNFILDFSPDGALAAVTRRKGKVVTILNLSSNAPQLTIDLGMEVSGLRVIGNNIVVIACWKVIAWNLPTEGCIPDARMGLEDSSWTINLEDMTAIFGSSHGGQSVVLGASISPNSCYIALTTVTAPELMRYLHLYRASTGEHLGHVPIERNCKPRFSPDGCDIWCAVGINKAEVYKVSSGKVMLDHLEDTIDIKSPPEGCPWASSQGYQVTDDWWILGPGGKRLFMLPPSWCSDTENRIWKGQFLALLQEGLSELVILEVEL